ncbi:MAG: PilZ domain-containing protein [Candidatus Omnitrophota bacterium]
MSEFEEKRKFDRYETEIKIFFQVTYDLATLVRYQVVDQKSENRPAEKYSALSKNVSVEGLCFTSDRSLDKGVFLDIEVYLPGQKDPVPMQGEVRWSRPFVNAKNETVFDTGVKIVVVDGKPVTETVFYDSANKIMWSLVLESIFGNFKTLIEKIKKS